VYFRRQIDPLIVALAVYGVLPRTAGSNDLDTEPRVAHDQQGVVPAIGGVTRD
jgi:hypothetical protein